ncbi:flagellar motor switch protein [Novosphingobium sp. Rr 2-17]|uniref:flagellar motor switch protein FliN n=1 Tax=Novosphingobium sp. Rr 2-17 TaxID=555793 RepID=UPI000269953A|nr:flagellar motor switch protein FliN [Novosphingobium sp. Rr 2-17]EIZ78725.1 flagellar motor switch protein [Novosphingobium sp. Rr 2-17]
MDIEPRNVAQARDAASDDQFPHFEDFDATGDLGMPVADALSSLQAVHDVPVTVQAVLGRARIAIGALMQLKENAVIELDRRVGEPVDIFVNNRLIARGEVVLIDNALGVTLTEIVRQER